MLKDIHERNKEPVSCADYYSTFFAQVPQQ